MAKLEDVVERLDVDKSAAVIEMAEIEIKACICTMGEQPLCFGVHACTHTRVHPRVVV